MESVHMMQNMYYIVSAIQKANASDPNLPWNKFSIELFTIFLSTEKK